MRVALLLGLWVACAPPLAAVTATPAPAETSGEGGFDTAGEGPATGLVRIVHREERYVLAGADAHALTEDLRRRRPRDERFTGWTRWKLRWRFDPAPTSEGCAVGPVDVRLELTTVLPAWDAPPHADARLVEAWQDYLIALEHHEAGHAHLAEEAAQAIRAALEDLPPAPDCSTLRARAHARGHAEVEQLRDANAHFDDTTDHGATQGAVFPTPRRLALDHRAGGT